MESQNPQVTIALITSIASILGVLLGAGITSLINWRLKTKETKLRIQEKIFDRRISAYVEVLDFAKSLRSTIATQKTDKSGQVSSYAVFLHNKENLAQLIRDLHQANNMNSHWLDNEVVKELKYIQDYLGNLGRQLNSKNDEDFPQIAEMVRDDFFELSTNLEDKALKFFENDIDKIKLNPTSGDKKLDEHTFQKRIQNTNLYNQIINNSELYPTSVLREYTSPILCRSWF